MTNTNNKYFRREADDLIYRIIETQDIMGQDVLYAVQMDRTTADILNDGVTQTGWEEVREDSITVDSWFIDIETDEYGMTEEEYYDPDNGVQPLNTSKLKAMLEQLNNNSWEDGPTRHWSIQYDDDMNRHERLKADMLPPDGTVGRAEDILGMIRARQETINMPPTVILNENKYPDSTSLGQAIDDMKQRHGDHAHIRIGKHGADDLLATYKNQETIGLSSVMDSAQGINIDFDAETLELIMQMKSKK